MRALKRLNAWLNDAALRDVSSRLNIVDIHERPADATLEWATAPGVSGQRLMTRTRQSVRIQIEFDIRELFDLTARAAIVTAANAWARDGILKVSYRPEQQIAVVLAEAASIEDARDVSSTFTITLQAAADPYWQDSDTRTLALSGSSDSGSIVVPGQAAAWPVVTVTPSSATLNTLTLNIGGQSMAFSGLAVSAGTTLKIDHDARGLLTIKAGIANKMQCRSAASADEFRTAPGSAEISYTANTSCAVNVAYRGRYL